MSKQADSTVLVDDVIRAAAHLEPELEEALNEHGLTRPSYLDDATGKKFAAAYARLRKDRRWQVVKAEDGVIVLHRTPSG